MVVSVNNGVFDAPIPGQSLTQPVGGMPFEHPPQFVRLDDALDFVWDKLHSPKSLVKLIGYLKADTPVELLARTIVYQGLLKNNWTVDVGLLMLQGVMWQIEAIAKLKNIKVTTFVDSPNETKDIIKISNLLASRKTKQMAEEEDKKSNFKGFF